MNREEKKTPNRYLRIWRIDDAKPPLIGDLNARREQEAMKRRGDRAFSNNSTEDIWILLRAYKTREYQYRPQSDAVISRARMFKKRFE